MRLVPWLGLVVVAACGSSPGEAPLDGSPGTPTDGAAGDGGGTDGAPARPPTWSSEMVAADEPGFDVRFPSTGTAMLGVADPAADDGNVAVLRLTGIPAFGPGDVIGTAHASEIGTRRDFHYGSYRTRVRLAACAPGEEVVNGLFTYFNDGGDHDGDGLPDNAEIDLEILCGTPAVLFMTVWTEYGNTGFRRWSQAIDFATGDRWEAPSDREYGLDRVGNEPALHLPQLLSPDTYVTLGFDWHADEVRYVAVVDGEELTLATLTDPARIPTLPSALLFNAWHPDSHWFGGGAAPDYPAADATLRVDWARYWD